MKARKRPAEPPAEDDGRTVAPMDVDGMPWYMRKPKGRPEPRPSGSAEPLKGRDLRRYLFSAVGTGLLITLVFGVAAALFILFCTQIWFQ